MRLGKFPPYAGYTIVEAGVFGALKLMIQTGVWDLFCKAAAGPKQSWGCSPREGQGSPSGYAGISIASTTSHLEHLMDRIPPLTTKRPPLNPGRDWVERGVNVVRPHRECLARLAASVELFAEPAHPSRKQVSDPPSSSSSL